MWSVVCHQGFQRLLMCVVVLCLLSFGYSSFAQDGANVPPNKDQREQELRDQLQNILNELDQLQKPEPDAPGGNDTECDRGKKRIRGARGCAGVSAGGCQHCQQPSAKTAGGHQSCGHTAVGDRFPTHAHSERVHGVSARGSPASSQRATGFQHFDPRIRGEDVLRRPGYQDVRGRIHSDAVRWVISSRPSRSLVHA